MDKLVEPKFPARVISTDKPRCGLVASKHLVGRYVERQHQRAPSLCRLAIVTLGERAFITDVGGGEVNGGEEVVAVFQRD